MLVRCLYASRATHPLGRTLLDSILAQSQANNVRNGITGILCFADDIFVQAIEGGRDEVCRLLGAILRDDRHRDVVILTYEEIAQRQFAIWTMGQVNLDTINPGLLLKYSEKAEFNPFACPGAATMALLSELVSNGAIVSRGKADFR